MNGMGFFASTIYFIFIFIAAILSIFIPFFIYRIRNESIAANAHLRRIVDLLGHQSTDAIFDNTYTQPTNNTTDQRYCYSCLNSKNEGASGYKCALTNNNMDMFGTCDQWVFNQETK